MTLNGHPRESVDRVDTRKGVQWIPAVRYIALAAQLEHLRRSTVFEVT
jgi:hypothetical protein